MPTLSPAPSLTPSPVSTTSDNSNHRPFAGGLLSSTSLPRCHAVVDRYCCAIEREATNADDRHSSKQIEKHGQGRASCCPWSGQDDVPSSRSCRRSPRLGNQARGQLT